MNTSGIVISEPTKMRLIDTILPSKFFFALIAGVRMAVRIIIPKSVLTTDYLSGEYNPDYRPGFPGLGERRSAFTCHYVS